MIIGEVISKGSIRKSLGNSDEINVEIRNSALDKIKFFMKIIVIFENWKNNLI